MTIEELNKQVDQKRGVSDGWPKDIKYEAVDEANAIKVMISDTKTSGDDVLKKIDPWGFAFLSEVKKISGKRDMELKFCIKFPPKKPQYEALKRRLSYLAIANNIKVTLEKYDLNDPLYSANALIARPANEVVRDKFGKRGDNDKPGRLEKDLQKYLYGWGLHGDSKTIKERTNERLALLGPDFVRIGKLKKKTDGNGYKVEREFPTGVFDRSVKEGNRILPTEYIDLVTINRNGELSLIELKFDDPKLEVISQVLNYALFFHSYRSQLTPLVDSMLSYSTSKYKFVTYLVSNIFHHKWFDIVFPYYAKGPLIIKQVIMGYMPGLRE